MRKSVEQSATTLPSVYRMPKVYMLNVMLNMTAANTEKEIVIVLSCVE